MDAHVGDHTVNKKDEKTWKTFETFNVKCLIKPGDISYIGGTNGTGKTNFQVCIMLDMALRQSDPFTPYTVFTNVGLKKDVFKHFNVIDVANMSQVFRKIAEDYVNDVYAIYLLFVDEWDNTVNSYKAIHRDTKNFMGIFVQIRKLDLGMNCIVHYKSDITHKHRKGNMLCFIQKGSWYPQNMTEMDSAISVGDIKKARRTAAIWWQNQTENITEIPNMAQYFTTKDNTTFKVDFDPAPLFHALGQMDPINDTPAEIKRHRNEKGRIILDFLDDYASESTKLTADQGEFVRTWRTTESWKATTKRFNREFDESLNHDTLRMRFSQWNKNRRKTET